MIDRRLFPIVLTSLRRFAVVGLVGSRQVGKTTLAKAITGTRKATTTYLDLERPSDLARLADPEIYLEQHRDDLVVIDEIQRVPDLFPLLRALVDADRRPSRFLVLGSASPELLRQTSETLTGRIVYHELPPLLLTEVVAAGIESQGLWLRGGYPPSLLAGAEDESLQWRESFIATYLERDLPQLGIRVPARQMRYFWEMVAHLHGQMWNDSSVARSLGVSAPTVRRYLASLEDAFLIRRLRPYHANLKKRLVKSPKVYLRDSGVLHALLRIPNLEHLLGHPCRGASWEGFVIEQIINLAPPAWDRSFYRTSVGAEIDLLLLPPGKPPVPIEIKATLSPTLSRGYQEAFRDLGCRRGFLVYAGIERFPLSREVTALPITQLDAVFAGEA